MLNSVRISILGLAICASAGAALAHEETETGSGGIHIDESGKKSIGIETTIVRQTMLPGTFSTSGKLEAIPALEFTQHAPLGGRIEQVLVRLGDSVSPGQELIRLNSPELQTLASQMVQEKTQLEAELAAKQAELDGEVSQTKTARDLAAANYRRDKQLHEEQIVSLKAMQTSKAELELSQNRLDVAERKREVGLNALRTKLRINVSALRQRLTQLGVADSEIAQMLSARAAITTVPVRTTRSGIITDLPASPGQAIDASVPIAQVSDLRKLWAVANIYESDMSKVRIGQRIAAQVAAFPDQTFEGKVTFISPNVDPASRSLAVKVEVQNPIHKLKPGMFAKLFLETSQPARVIVLPKDAVVFNKDKSLVYVQKGNDFEPRTVEVGNAFSEQLQIISGVRPGELVVTRGAFQLDAQRLKQAGDTDAFTHPTEEGEHEEHEQNANGFNPQVLIVICIAFVLGLAIPTIFRRRPGFLIREKLSKTEKQSIDKEAGA